MEKLLFNFAFASPKPFPKCRTKTGAYGTGFALIPEGWRLSLGNPVKDG